MKTSSLAAVLFLLVTSNMEARDPGPIPDVPALPVTFTENHGQVDGRARFVGRGDGVQTWVVDDGFRVRLAARGVGVHLFFTFEGASDFVEVAPGARRDETVNLFLGDDPEEWRTDVPVFSEVWYRGLYEGVDARLYDRDGRIEYDLVVSARARLEEVVVRVEGADRLRLDGDGSLVVETAAGPLRQVMPETYRLDEDGRRVPVSGRFVILAGDRFGFAVDDRPDSGVVVIDPGLEYGTYVGSIHEDAAHDVAADLSFNAYVIGTTNTNVFPVSAGAFDTSLSGPTDAFVFKLNPAGTARVWATYLGGTGDEEGLAIEVDPQGRVFACGMTKSTDFPDTIHDPGLLPLGNDDGFCTLLSAGGNQIVWSRFVGGEGDDEVLGIDLPWMDGPYLTGFTESTTFPTTAGAYDRSHNGGKDAFVVKLDLNGNVTRSTYVGGSGDETGRDVSAAGAHVCIVGDTESADFRLHGDTTAGTAHDTTFGGGDDAFVATFSTGSLSVEFITFLGHAGDDRARAVDIDAFGNAYVAGTTTSALFPTTSNAHDKTLGGERDVFISYLTTSGLYLTGSTFVGGSNRDSVEGIEIDNYGFVWIAGDTRSVDFPLLSDPISATHHGGDEVYAARFTTTKLSLDWSTLLGGPADDELNGLDVSHGYVFLAGGTQSGAPFPVTTGAYRTTPVGAKDGFVMKLRRPGCVFSSTVTSIGTGKPGSAGIPILAAAGAVKAGSPPALKVTKARPKAAAHCYVGLDETKLPFDGGFLYTTPKSSVPLGLTDKSGTLPFKGVDVTSFLPFACGRSLIYQVAILDPAAAGTMHYALTNGLRIHFGN